MHSLLNDLDSIRIVRECHQVEACFASQLTEQVLSNADCVSIGSIKQNVLQIDKVHMLAACEIKAPLIADVCKSEGSWPAVWDSARHLESCHTLDLQFLTHLLAHHGRSSSSCPRCNVNLSDSPISLMDHVLVLHTETTKLTCFSTQSVISKIPNSD